MHSYHSRPAQQSSTSMSYDSSSVSSTASPTAQPNPSMSFTGMSVPNRSMSNLSPFQNAHHSAPPLYAGYDSGSISPNEQASHTFHAFVSDGTTGYGTATNQSRPTSPHNTKRAYRQRRKDPSCDACRERKVKCDATDASSCSECSSRNVRCQFTKETNRRMSSIKQVQDLERQLFQARQQVNHLRAMASKDDLSIGLAASNPPQWTPDLPALGLPLQRRPKRPIAQDYSRVRLNLRSYSGSLLRAPAPHRRVGSEQRLPPEVPNLPPKQTADRLLGQYFDHVHLRFPILHKPTFYAEYQKVYKEGTLSGMRRGWGAVLFCVLACGAVHTLDRNRVQEGEEFLTKGTAMVDFWQDELSVDQAKMAFLASIFLTEINLRSAAWVWLAAAARIAQDAGLHVETGSWPAVEGEMRRRIWHSIYALDRLLALELSKPLMIDDVACDTGYPEPVDDQYITNHGILPDGRSIPLLAIIHIVRSVQPLLRLFKTEYISPETLQSYDRYFDACHDLFPRPLSLSSNEPLEPRSIAPVIYLQNVRLMLHRHNLSPVYRPDVRHRAADACVKIALNTSQVMSRCMSPASIAHDDLAVSATTLLCTHLWRCTLFLLFRGEYGAASALVQALSTIGLARTVTIDCGRHIAFFIQCITDRLRSGDGGDFERDEELMAYVSADLQSSAENSWIWPDSEAGAHLGADSNASRDPVENSHDVGSRWPPFAGADLNQTTHQQASGDEATSDWDDWEQVERSLRHLLEQQRLQRQQMQSRESHLPPIAIPPPKPQPAPQQPPGYEQLRDEPSQSLLARLTVMPLKWSDGQSTINFASWCSWLLLTWLLIVSGGSALSRAPGLPENHVAGLRKEAEDLFYHGFDNYMKHAFPEDELRPISCRPLTRDRDNPAHVEVNDVLGNYSLTLIDSLSTLAILASSPPSNKKNKPLELFQNGVKDLVDLYGDGTPGSAGQGVRARGFDLDSKVQVFETVIRGVGGLLSAHLFAVGELPIRGYAPPAEQAAYARLWSVHEPGEPEKGILWDNGFLYDGQLLRLAYDLGNRLIPAFFTATGIPYPRVNLRHGIPFYPNSPYFYDAEDGHCDLKQASSVEITETCSAGAGSLVLEFTVLSRLTGDGRFEDLAKRAFWAIWSRRSDIGLIGAGVDAESGHWIGSLTGIGAGIDSFFEYALKSHILLSRDVHPEPASGSHKTDPRMLFGPLKDEEQLGESFLLAWNDAHAAIERHLYRGPSYQHPHYVQADLFTGATRAFWIDSLSAYYPGLLVLSGHIDEAIETHLLTTAVWTRFSALPERWNTGHGGVEGGLGWWPGRPEFIESTYHLYRATQDPWYVHVAEMVLRDIKRRCWTTCGWAGIQDVRTGEKADRMESFFLGETAKYLFLLFDVDHPLNHLDEPYVFTTEGHPLVIPRTAGSGAPADVMFPVEAALPPPVCEVPPRSVPLSMSAVAARKDMFHAAALARLHLMPTREAVESVIGEYAADHPSISMLDINSPSNYTYFPWTLPPALVPRDGTSAPMAARPTFDIAFPALPDGAGQPQAPLQRVKEGILINSIGGLRLGMIQDVPLAFADAPMNGYRIQAINNLGLGKDEKVFLAKDTGHRHLNPTDPNFTRLRDQQMLDLVLDLEASPDPSNHTDMLTPELILPDVEMSPSIKSALGSLLASMSALLRQSPPKPFTLTPSLDASAASGSRFYIPAITPTGIGAAAIPDWIEAPSPSTSGFSSIPLQWTSVYATDQLCSRKLPLAVPRKHQIVVIKRGGCSFSEKLANIPAFAPSPTSLQLVVVVNYGDEHGEAEGMTANDLLIRPHLDEQQFTSGGLLRHNPVPMVLVGGGERSYEALRRAVGVGIKRRYTMHAQGIPISNLIII